MLLYTNRVIKANLSIHSDKLPYIYEHDTLTSIFNIMEIISLFYDNAQIYSPNLFFIFLALLLSFIILLIGNGIYLFMRSIRYTAEYIYEIQGKRKKTRLTRIKFLLKIIFVVYMIVNKKKDRIIFYVRKVLDVIKEEVLIKEEERI